MGNNPCFRHSLCASLALRQTHTYTIKHFMVFIHCSWQIWGRNQTESQCYPSGFTERSTSVMKHEAQSGWAEWDEMIKYGLIIRQHTEDECDSKYASKEQCEWILMSDKPSALWKLDRKAPQQLRHKYYIFPFNNFCMKKTAVFIIPHNTPRIQTSRFGFFNIQKVVPIKFSRTLSLTGGHTHTHCLSQDAALFSLVYC